MNRELQTQQMAGIVDLFGNVRTATIYHNVPKHPNSRASLADAARGGYPRKPAEERSSMFTIKFYSGDGCRQVIREAESFTILRCRPGPEDDGTAEITLHQKNPSDDYRIDIKDDGTLGLPFGYSGPPRFAKAIIENLAGKTTEIVYLRPGAANAKACAPFDPAAHAIMRI